MLGTDGNGDITSSSLPVGTKNAKGILQVGDGIDVSNGVISVQEQQSVEVKDTLFPGERLATIIVGSSEKRILAPYASADKFGVVKIGDGLQVDNGVLSVANTVSGGCALDYTRAVTKTFIVVGASKTSSQATTAPTTALRGKTCLFGGGTNPYSADYKFVPALVAATGSGRYFDGRAVLDNNHSVSDSGNDEEIWTGTTGKIANQDYINEDDYNDSTTDAFRHAADELVGLNENYVVRLLACDAVKLVNESKDKQSGYSYAQGAITGFHEYTKLDNLREDSGKNTFLRLLDPCNGFGDNSGGTSHMPFLVNSNFGGAGGDLGNVFVSLVQNKNTSSSSPLLPAFGVSVNIKHGSYYVIKGTAASLISRDYARFVTDPMDSAYTCFPYFNSDAIFRGGTRFRLQMEFSADVKCVGLRVVLMIIPCV